MQDKQYSVFSPSANSILSSGVYVVDVTQEPLMALKLIIDGLPANSGHGVWMGPFEQIPRVHGFAPYDLIFLDAGMRVLLQEEVHPGDEFPASPGIPSSLLILPQGTLSSVRFSSGEQLVFYIPDSPGALPTTGSSAVQKLPRRGSSGNHKPIDVPAPPPVVAAKQAENTKEHTIKRFLRWIDPTLVSPADMRISLRRPSPELVAYRSMRGYPNAFRIGDISSTGIYLLTYECWPIGEKVKLTLQREGPVQEDFRQRVEIEAEVVRQPTRG